ncbi:MAG: HXXEE domain-containing protein [Alphaproteobacteria bacterium]|nr:HXXEE domain-containing protein [Alphaproteobacteria bacterium]
MRLSLRQWGAVLFVLFVCHNAEEAFGFVYANDNGLRLLDSLGMRSLVVSPEAFLGSLGIVTTFSALVAAWIVFAPETRATLWVVRIWAAILVVNVFVPHLPAAILAGSYVPGVATAVLLNLPLSVACLRATSNAWPTQT